MKIMVTGGAGFIGSQVVDGYLKEGYEVVVVDNLSTGKKENLNPRAKFHCIDILDPKLEKIFREEKPDYLNHHAAQIEVRKSVSDPMGDFRINVGGTLQLLELCRKYPVRKFIFASTGGAIYGEVETIPTGEEHLPDPLSPYGVSKYIVENYLRAYHQVYGIPYTILRYGNVYGPRQNPLGEAGVVAIFTHRMLRGEPPVIFGSGEQIRDYIHCEDVVRANFLALTEGENETLNIGTGKGTTIKEIFQMLKEIIGFQGAPLYEEEKKGDLKKSILDISRAEEKLRWRPRVKLREGLINTVNYFKEGNNQ